MFGTRIEHMSRPQRLIELLATLQSRRRATAEELAQELGVSVTDVTNYLSFARREFRRTVLEKLREITASEEEYRMEARAVLGVGD